MATITYDSTTRVYPGAERPAVDTLDLDIADGEFLVLVGPSGCGKSTSLRMLAGLEDVTSGAIRIGERDVTDLPPRERDIAMVFQNYALYPHMTVAQNMGFALKIAGRPKQEIHSRVAEAAELLGLEGYLDRKPKALSGGQRQRVAMGRAIVRQPQVFLMDEPLSNLDAKLRVSTRTQIAALQRRLGVTTVYVTHDQVEAMTMGDRVAVLDEGRLQQCATPRELYERPANAFVAGFIGSPAMNLLDGRVTDDGVEVHGARLAVTRAGREAVAAEGNTSVTVGFRPEAVEISGSDGAGADDDDSVLGLTVNLVEELGSDAFVHGSLNGAEPVGAEPEEAGADVIARVDPRKAPSAGERVSLLVRPEGMHLFAGASGRRIDG